MAVFSCPKHGKECVKTCTDCNSTTSAEDSSLDVSKDMSDDRGTWVGRLDFLLSCIGYAVGLGNIWRFPYLCYKSGGGAFLIPYIVFLLLCGLPMFFLEVSIGQFCSLSPITLFKFSPIFKGVGYGMVLVSGIVCIYYNIIITWTLYYLFMSFRAVLPWSTCNNTWNTANCTTVRVNASEVNLVDHGYIENLAHNSSLIDGTYRTSFNYTQGYSFVPNATNLTYTTASEEYWRNHVLDISPGIEDIGTIRWQLLLCLILAWVLVFLCLCKGVKSSGRVVYVTATFPYLVLLILLIRGVTLEGASQGIYYYLVPEWDKLTDLRVWGKAAVQIFYSVGMSWGGIITMASYNRFNNNVYRDAMIVPILNCGTSIFAGLVIFSILGNMAYTTGLPINEVVTEGPGLTFVVYPEAVTNLPFSPIWAVLFFLMLLTIGLDSQFGMFETMTSAFIDEFPQYLKHSKKTTITAVMCLIEFLLGLPCITNGGAYILQIMDWYCSSFSLMILSVLEVVSVAWIYGASRLFKDISLMIGYQPHAIWKYMWMFVTPLVTLMIWLFSVSSLKAVTYGDYKYPDWAIVIGWLLGIMTLAPTPIVAIYQILKQDGTPLERIVKASRPEKSWGPALPENHERYLASLNSRERLYLMDTNTLSILHQPNGVYPTSKSPIPFPVISDCVPLKADQTDV